MEKGRLSCSSFVFEFYLYKNFSFSGGAVSSIKKAASPKPPSGGGAFKKINDDDWQGHEPDSEDSEETDCMSSS